LGKSEVVNSVSPMVAVTGMQPHPYGDLTDSAAVARHLCSLTVAATLVAGRPTHLAL
jgi:hypothetical protein